MNFRYYLLSAALMSAGCQTRHSARQPVEVRPGQYKTVDYVTVGKLMDSVQAPYIIELKEGQKHLLFAGLDHNNDSTHRQYQQVEELFTRLQPQIAFNEGGQIPESLRFTTRNEAVNKKGNTGFIKYLADKTGCQLVDGDTHEEVEFPVMLKKYPKDKLFLYYIMERLVIPYVNGAYGYQAFPPLYDKAVARWFVARGFPLTEEEQQFAWFLGLYQRFMGEPFEPVLNQNIEKFDYINPDCEFCAIGRSSKMLRDSVLLDKIDAALATHDRVAVTFGHGHALAVEPALKQLMKKWR